MLGKRSGFQKQEKSNIVTKKSNVGSKKPMPELKENESKLSIAYEALPDFDHKVFLSGAKYAFETIIDAFNKSDKKTLKTLLTKEVFLSFEKAIDENNNNPGFQFYSLTVDGVDNVLLEKNLINITLKITSEQFADNDETTIKKKQDFWTFQKNVNDNSPVWLLSST